MVVVVLCVFVCVVSWYKRMSLIVSSVCWVKKGKLSAFPRTALEEDEGPATSADLARMAATVLGVKPDDHADDDDEMMDDDGKEDRSKKPEEDDEDAKIVKEFHLENYDEEELRPALTMKPYYENQEDDPYLKRGDGADDDDGMDSETEESAVLEDDILLLAATTEPEDNFSHLDAHIYEERDRNLFCHHDYLLPAFPLALAYIDTVLPSSAASKPGVLAVPHKNIVAVGTMETAIELWDLDIIDSIECVATLGGPVDRDEANGMLVSRSGAKKKGKKKGGKQGSALKPGSHTDSVIALATNPVKTNVLASGSADHTVKIWDVSTLSLVSTFDHIHTDKVQSIEWCPSDPAVLLTAGFDRRICAIDVRAPSIAPPALSWTLSDADPECVAWLPWRNGHFLVSQENGIVRCFDALRGMPPTSNLEPLWTLAAHEKAASALAVNPKVPGFIVTGSLDRTMKLWNISEAPSLLFSRNVNTSVFCASFNKENDSLLGFGTSHGVRVWDVSELRSVRTAFSSIEHAPSVSSHKKGEEEDEDVVKADKDGLFEVLPPGQSEDEEKKKKKKKNPMDGVLPPALLRQMPRGHKKRFTKAKFSPKSVGK